ncbi:hypothetical protein [Priestia megaterium]|uniref:hypothetical protein n=1 Tax=Priestia megaterium TaxID=1404 RepID=UPI00064C7739|nr:hypothetical protein [Priestia megaterium]KLV29237.1 hypothetical protein ABW04_25450 [Priestia megaterium]MDN4634513.1 hypothetical protein [Sphingomonas sp. PsM26]
MKKFIKYAVVLIIGICIGGFMFSGGTEETTITSEETTDTASATDEVTKAEPKKEKASVQVFSNDQVTISYKEVTAEGVKFLVENKTDKSLTIQADSVAINGFSVNSNDISMSDDIAPKSKGYAVAMTDKLTDAGTPEKISGSLRVIDMNSTNMETIQAQFTDVAIK